MIERRFGKPKKNQVASQTVDLTKLRTKKMEPPKIEVRTTVSSTVDQLYFTNTDQPINKECSYFVRAKTSQNKQILPLLNHESSAQYLNNKDAESLFDKTEPQNDYTS